MATQYDSIGQRYGDIKSMPAAQVEKPSIQAVLGDMSGLNCLDLACGLGYWTKYLLENGAGFVTGVDISPAMIEGARQASTSWPASMHGKSHFVAADCSKPMDVAGGPFDLVFAVWFLNYAGTYEEQLGMWRNMYQNLKPGGRVIAMTVNVHLPFDTPNDDRYGIRVEPIATVKDGWKCRLRAYTQPENLVFDMYHLSKEVHEGGAAEAGFVDLKWNGQVLPDDERRDSGYWDKFMERPLMEICTARRPA